MFSCARYLAGEGGDTRLKEAFYFLLECAEDGIESHEIFGEEFVREIIKEHDLTVG